MQFQVAPQWYKRNVVVGFVVEVSAPDSTLSLMPTKHLIHSVVPG